MEIKSACSYKEDANHKLQTVCEIVTDNGESMEIIFNDSLYTLVVETYTDRTCWEEFPMVNWNKKLWNLLYARFRTRCKS